MAGNNTLSIRGKNSVSQSPRLVFPSTSRYSNKVLVGPWVYDRINATKPPQVSQSLSTTYEEHFPPKISPLDPSVVWDQKIKTEHSNFIPQTGRSEFPNYFENFSSVYDLSFNHFPKCVKTDLKRKRLQSGKFIPIEEYLPTFGNLTKYGLLEIKKEQWDCECQDPRKNVSTQYIDSFVAPEIDDYKFKRFAIPVANSSLMDETNRLTTALQLRDRPSFKVVAPQDLVEIPRPSQWNPITWECIPEKSFLEKKMCSNQNISQNL